MRTTFLFCMSIFLFYDLVHTTFFICMSIFLFYYLVRTTFFILYVDFSFLLSRENHLYFIFWWKARLLICKVGLLKKSRAHEIVEKKKRHTKKKSCARDSRKEKSTYEKN